MTSNEILSSLFPLEEVKSIHVNLTSKEYLNFYPTWLVRFIVLSALLAPRAVLVTNILHAVPFPMISNLSTYTEYAFAFFPSVFSAVDYILDLCPVIGPIIGFPTGFPPYLYGALHYYIQNWSQTTYFNTWALSRIPIIGEIPIINRIPTIENIPIVGHQIVPILVPLLSAYLIQKFFKATLKYQ